MVLACSHSAIVSIAIASLLAAVSLAIVSIACSHRAIPSPLTELIVATPFCATSDNTGSGLPQARVRWCEIADYRVWGGCCSRGWIPVWLCGVQSREVLGMLLDALLELDEDGEEEAALVSVALELIEHLQSIDGYIWIQRSISCSRRGKQ